MMKIDLVMGVIGGLWVLDPLACLLSVCSVHALRVCVCSLQVLQLPLVKNLHRLELQIPSQRSDCDPECRRSEAFQLDDDLMSARCLKLTVMQLL